MFDIRCQFPRSLLIKHVQIEITCDYDIRYDPLAPLFPLGSGDSGYKCTQSKLYADMVDGGVLIWPGF